MLIGHSTSLKAGEHVLIEAFDAPEAFVRALIEQARRVGGHPHVALRSNRILRALVDGADEAQIATWATADLERMKGMDAYLGVRGSGNVIGSRDCVGVINKQIKCRFISALSGRSGRR